MATRLDIEYDGGAFHGWAAQPGLRTVQEEMERALATIRREPTALTVGGRTDRGVHAAAQVASHAGPPAMVRSLNAVLARDVRVRASRQVADGFDARRDATSRTYCFRLLHRREASAFERGTVVHWRYPMRHDLLDACAALLVGEHDFTAFTPTETQHARFRRRIGHAVWTREGDELRFWIEGDAFMRHMNRALVGTMLEVAGGRRELASFAALLAGAPREDAGATIAPHGLHLVGIDYPDVLGGPSRAAVAWGRPPWGTLPRAPEPPVPGRTA